MGLTLSVCFGTLNRLHYLKPCLESIRQSAGEVPYEIVIADGGSTDGTVEFLREQEQTDPHLRVLYIGERTGAIRAFNACFYAARGQYVANLNDDCTVEGDTLARACAFLDDRPEVGQVAIPFSNPGEEPHVDYVNLWKRKLLYANFGVTRAELGRKAKFWGEFGYQYAGDTELSIKIWLMERYVLPLAGGHIIHYQARDDTRVPNVESHRIGKTYNNMKAPNIVIRMGTPRPETNLSKPRPVKPLRVQQPARIIIRKKKKNVPGVEGMTLSRYFGNGWQVNGAPTCTAYKFSGGAEFYVDDRDLEFILSNHPQGHKVQIV